MSPVPSHVQQVHAQVTRCYRCRVSDLTRYCCRLEILDSSLLLTSSARSPITCENIIFPREFAILRKNVFFAYLTIKTSLFILWLRRIASIEIFSKIISRDGISQMQTYDDDSSFHDSADSEMRNVISLRARIHFISTRSVRSQE